MTPLRLPHYFRHVRAVLLVLVTDVFDKIAIRDQVQGHLDAEGPRLILRIIECEIQIHVAEIAGISGGVVRGQVYLAVVLNQSEADAIQLPNAAEHILVDRFIREEIHG